MPPNPRVINLHITSYLPYPEPLSTKRWEPELPRTLIMMENKVNPPEIDREKNASRKYVLSPKILWPKINGPGVKKTLYKF